MFKLSVVYLLAVYINFTYGHGRFRREIPNGFDVPHPCGGSVTWDAVGHMEPQYAPKKNAFGEHVQAMLRQTGGDFDWSKVCRLDSDGDGLTNGQELGDPRCTWRVGDPAPGPATGHPGLCEPGRSQCTRGFTYSQCPNEHATGSSSRPRKRLPVGANDHPQTFFTKNGGRSMSQSIGSLSSIGRQMPSQSFPWQSQSRPVQTSGFGTSSFPRGMAGSSIFGPSSSRTSQFSSSFGRGSPLTGTSIFSEPSFSASSRNSASWQTAPSSSFAQSRGGFSPSFVDQSSRFSRFEDPGMGQFGGQSGFSSGFNSGVSSGMGSGGSGGMGPGMFGPQGPPPFWMRNQFRRF